MSFKTLSAKALRVLSPASLVAERTRAARQALPFEVTVSVKIRRGNHVFLSWTGDHRPRHVHVYKDGKLVVKWDLENREVMRGTMTKRVLRLIDALEAEGLL